MDDKQLTFFQKFQEHPWFWLVEIGFGIVIFVLISLALHRFIVYLRERNKTKGHNWQRRIDRVISLPLQVAIWSVGVIYVVDVVASHLGFEDISESMGTLRSGFIVACVGWIALRWLKAAFERLHQKSSALGVAPGTIHALSKLSAFVVAIITLMLIFTVYGFNILPLLAFGGIGMAGVAFAAQDIIGNFFGGAMLHFTRPFVIGDMVSIPSQQMFEGTVEEIGWYMSMLRSFDKEPVYFPNALFTKMNVVNLSRRTHRRIRETVGLRYDDMSKINPIIAALKPRLLAHPKVDNNQIFNVVLDKYGDYGLNLYIHLLTTAVLYSDFLDVKHDVLMIAYDVIYENGAEIAYPTSEVYLKDKR
jgi:MscS family membrane protein